MDVLPPFVFEGHPDRRMVAAAVRYVSRRRLWIVRLVGVFIALIGAGLLFVDGGLTPGVTFGVLGLFWIVAMPVIAVRKAIRASLKIIGHPTAYRVDAEGAHQSSPMVTSTFRWPMITGIEELPDQVLVRVGKLQFLPLPTTSLPAATRAAMVAFLRDRLAGSASPAVAAPPVALRPPTP